MADYTLTYDGQGVQDRLDKVVPNETAIANNGIAITDNSSSIGGLSKYVQPTSGTSVNIEVTVTGSNDRVFIDIPVTISGGNITVNVNGGGAFPLYTDYALTEQSTELEAGVYEILNRTTAFYLAPKGADEWGGLEFVVNQSFGGLYSTEINTDKLYEIDQDTGLEINSAVPPDTTNPNGIGGMETRLFHSHVNVDRLYELSPDTLLSINGPVASPSGSPYGLGGVSSNRLYNQDREVDLIYEIDPNTLLQISSASSPSTNGYGIGGAENRLYTTNLGGTDVIYELELNTKLQISSANAPGLSSSTFGIGGTTRLFVSNIGDDLTYELDLDTKLEISSFANQGGNQYSVGGITKPLNSVISITSVLFNGTEYELTDDSNFRVSGVSA